MTKKNNIGLGLAALAVGAGAVAAVFAAQWIFGR